MEDKDKTREQLLGELADLRRSAAEMQDLIHELRSESSLGQSEPKYKALFENALAGILLTAPDGSILDANEAACRMFGLTKEELCRVGREGVVDATDSRLAPAMEQRSIKGSWSGEINFKRKNGPIFPADISSNIFQDVDGNEKTSMIIRDITEKKRTEEALRGSEIRYRTLFENMSNAVAIFGAERDGEDFVILDFNKAASMIEQIASNEVIGKSVLAVFPGVREFGLFEVFQSVWKTGKAEHYPVALYKDQRISGWRDNFVYRLPSGEVVAVYSDETERKKAELALRESESRFQAFMENSPMVAFMKDHQGRFVYGNQKWLAMHNLIGSDWLGKTSEQIFPPDLAARFTETDNIALAENRLFQYVVPVPNSDGSLSHWLAYKFPFQDVDGPQYVGGAAIDITDRLRAEEEIRENEEKFRIAADFSYDWEYWIDANGTFVYMSPGCERITGYSREQFLGNPSFLETIVHPDDKEFFKEHIIALERGILSDSSLFEFRIIDSSGDIRWIEHACQDVFGTTGTPLGRRASQRDITRRKKVEEELRQRTEELKTLLDAQPALVLFAHDPECRIITGNQTANEILGVPPDTNVSQTAKEKPQGILIKRLKADGTEYRTDELPLQRAATTEKSVFDEEIEYRFPDGRQMFIRGNAAPLFDAKGTVRGAVAAFLDITRLKQVEREREALRIQFLHAQKMEAIGTLAAGIAHDFNNMLQVILGYADLLVLDKKPGEPGYQELRTIIQTSYHARDLVQKIRLVGRKADIKQVPLELNYQVKEVSELLSQTLPRSINIYTHLAENLATINADPGLMNQMVMNLAINAGEAMPDGGTLSIQTENTVLEDDFCQQHPGLKPGLYVLLSVSDTGIGIQKEQLERIFDPFYSTKMRDYHKGTGLGLPVVRGIVEMHNGFMDFESEVGSGTTFRVYLPVLEAATATKTVEDISLPPGGTETILLVEDEEIVRNLGRDVLEQFGYRVLLANDGQEAVEVYGRDNNSISLVILDIIMPRMDGKRCFQELLRINPGAKVLISSGIMHDELIQEVVKLGARDSLIKPFDVRALLQKVREVLDAD